MSPLPTRMQDRWQSREEPPVGSGTIYWHVLFYGQPHIRAAAKAAQARLADFGGFHMTPERWLHMTTLAAGSADGVSPEQLNAMLFKAREELARVDPIPVNFERVLYHPEAVMLAIEPAAALLPLRRAAQQATHEAVAEHRSDEAGSDWKPHLTVSYSTTQQPADPIISALGREIPKCQARIDELSLVIQRGPERLWDWQVVGTAKLGPSLYR
ncbi:2'-5' RNA ligase family protein [Spirillospora sp. NPDC047279]|uniref:2'-5' RNA ligase family protein n=1 Tax=Spirillospora sp. NPDC047279 TaxID=3155478 RepID=UPI0033F8DCE1